MVETKVEKWTKMIPTQTDGSFINSEQPFPFHSARYCRKDIFRPMKVLVKCRCTLSQVAYDNIVWLLYFGDIP